MWLQTNLSVSAMHAFQVFEFHMRPSNLMKNISSCVRFTSPTLLRSVPTFAMYQGHTTQHWILKCLRLVFRERVARPLSSSPGQCCLRWPFPLAPAGLSFSTLFSHTHSMNHGTTGLGLTYQTLAGTLCCHMAGNGTWKTLGKEEKNLRDGCLRSQLVLLLLMTFTLLSSRRKARAATSGISQVS